MKTDTHKTLDTIILDPAIWLRGESFEGSKLLRPRDGKQCCLGIAASFYGVDPKQLRDNAMLQQLNTALPSSLACLVVDGRDTMDAFSLYMANDNAAHISGDEERVDRLNTILARADAPFRFVLGVQADAPAATV